MPQVNHAGFEGGMTADGVDYNITEWKCTLTTTTLPTSNTSNYDVATDTFWTDKIRGASSAEGSFKFNFDSSLLPYPALGPGKTINTLVLKLDRLGHQISMKAIVKSLKPEPEGLDGLVTVEVAFENKGLVTLA